MNRESQHDRHTDLGDVSPSLSVAGTRQKIHAEYDVAVLGGGTIGLIYAIWLKLMRPATTIIVLEQQTRLRHKIGESLLSPTMRCFLSLGIPLPVLRRLFANKEGLSFWWTDTSSNQLQTRVDVVGLDETIQVERRVLETLLMEHARRHGVHVLQGIHVDVAHSSLTSSIKELLGRYADGTTQRICARLLCDASGPASVLARSLGSYNPEPDPLEPLDTFNANSYFGYFRQKRDLTFPYLDRSATRHLCFPDGWLWLISIASWEKSSDEALLHMIEHLLDSPDGADHTYPIRYDLQEQFATTCEPIVSIGFVIRHDRDIPAKRSAHEMFEYYCKKYPAIQEIMSHYELIEDPYLDYPKDGYKSRLRFSHHSTRVTGDGWLQIGDAAFFVNPLISPGINYGVGTAYVAAKATAKALDQGDSSQGVLAPYEEYIKSVRQILFAETDMYHRSFMYRQTYERVFAFRFFAITEVLPLYGLPYQESDPSAYDVLNPQYLQRVQGIRKALIEGEQGIISSTEVIQRVHDIVESARLELLGSQDLASLHLGRFFQHYTDKLERVEHKLRERALIEIVSCSTCKTFVNVEIQWCPICGSQLSEVASLSRKEELGAEQAS